MNNTADNPKLFDKEINPFYQCLVVLISIPVFTFLFYVPSWSGWTEVPQHQAWTESASMLSMFGVCNSVLSLSADNVTPYWNKSIYSYIIVCVVGGAMAWWFSGLSISEAKSFKWIYIVFTFGYLLFLSIVSLMRKIVFIAQEQDKRLRGESDE